MTTGEQQRRCPICEESKTLRGLHGHLKIKHQLQKEEVLEMVKKTVPVQVDDAAGDTDQDEIRKMLQELEDRVTELENHWDLKDQEHRHSIEPKANEATHETCQEWDGCGFFS